MSRKKPLSRALREPEEILTFAHQVRKFLAPYLKWLLWGSLLLLVVLLGIGGYRSFKSYREGKAQEALERLRPQLHQKEKAEETLKGLSELLRHYPGTRAAWLALAYQGGLLYQNGRFEEAARIYEEMAAKVEMLRDTGWNPFVIESLSYCYEAQGDYLRAAETLRPLADVAPGNFAHLVLSRLASLYEKAGQPEEARKYWERLLAKSPSPALTAYLREKMGPGGGEKSATGGNP